MKTKTPTKFPFQEELIDHIKKELPLHSIYVISVYKEKQRQDIYLSPQLTSSQKAITYTLLIICHKPIFQGLGDFMDDMYNKMQQRCKVYAIVYTLSIVIKRINVGDNFLIHTIHKLPVFIKKMMNYQGLVSLRCVFIDLFMNLSMLNGITVWNEQIICSL